MGSFLDKPKTDKQSEAGTGNGLHYGLSSMQGWRIEMEDAHAAVASLPSNHTNWAYFAVFDGHAGAGVSAYCAANLLDSILKTEQFQRGASGNNKVDVTAGIRAGFLNLDERMKSAVPQIASGEDKSGSTAVCALISDTHLYISNCGDSRAVLARGGEVALATTDHKPSNPIERERIVNAGGSVMIQRVNGSLAVSRALGDFDFKMVEGRGPTEQLVSPEPDVYVLDRSENDEFLILACDGIWDVISSRDLCDYIRSRLRISDKLDHVCNEVVDTCLSMVSII
jgi:protein phosphatase 1B